MLDSTSHLRPVQTNVTLGNAAVSNPNNAFEELAIEIKQLRKDVNDIKIKIKTSYHKSPMSVLHETTTAPNLLTHPYFPA